MNNEWITDRRPHRDDGPYVYRGDGAVRYYTEIPRGEIWKPIPKCEPYVKPKRYTAKWLKTIGCWGVMNKCIVMTELRLLNCDCYAHREAAERIAAIYDEVVP